MATRYELEELASGHDFLGKSHDRNARRTRWVVALTAVMMVAEIAAGWATGSMALLADGFHMATHAGALSIAAGAYWYAKRHSGNPRFTFGTGKVGDLAGFGSAVILGIFAIGIAVESVMRLLDPVAVDFIDAIVVAVVGLLVNIVSALMLGQGHDHGHDHAHGHGHHHDHDHDQNLRAAYLHVLADALTSVAAIAALVSGRFLGWLWLDPAVAIVASLVIARWSLTLMRQTAAVLLDTADRDLLDRIKAAVELDGDATVTDLHVWRVGPGAHAAIISACGDATAEQLRARVLGIRRFAHLTVEKAADDRRPR
ncbi:CDF family Co(II)/Ni(II) efflux transporter DmeF [Sphingomonas sabuli]|uniref:CDF family Co(II)/Ni(II) efflux transporter DmeF n=1 Tax=Sphingomonas sabuli TaxID=2764186 RepID=A0A7G9L1K3_9SPHN|nr:CDF family Co(II)/Ni(II) efflux transporter DmeF [Sphingomonas sabuli]QNM82502.1 CDF family Co(II)/Ni(II) efflux transporter DmeF [Sphingomonas sabuli]